GSSLLHEIGHYFGLLHTHGITNSMPTDELVDYSNCLTAGDDVCDTPAEPNLQGLVDSNCVYTGSLVDNAGLPFDPDPYNVMSYAPKPCRTQITPNQYDRMSYIATYLRDYVHCPSLSASFEVSDPVALCTGQQTCQLTYSGVGATAYAWDVNDDGITDYDTSVISHMFSGPGLHKVCLTVSEGQDTVTHCIQDAVTIMDMQPLPYAESFDSLVHGAMINPDLHYGWTIGDLGPNHGGRSLVIDNYHYNNSDDEEDYFVIGPFDLTTIPVPYLAYRTAYAPFSENRWDALRVEISTDCGATFDEVAYDEGLSLSSIGNYMPHQWMPSDSLHWRDEKIGLSEYYNDTILIRFTNITGFGNNLYLDDIVIEPDPVLAFAFITFEVQARSGGYLLSWYAGDAIETHSYDVQFSRDGTTFQTVAHVQASRNYHDAAQYLHRT
ncbi:MAG: PKD domain-containing protein, partial [Saprospiraceae bacterium]|nr:PKD domain-containing protein [Saprospiraceae bacterium]